MGTGEPGRNGLAALRHVEVGQEAGQETVTTQRLLMEGENVRSQVMSQERVIKILVQVQLFLCPLGPLVVTLSVSR